MRPNLIEAIGAEEYLKKHIFHVERKRDDCSESLQELSEDERELNKWKLKKIKKAHLRAKDALRIVQLYITTLEAK